MPIKTASFHCERTLKLSWRDTVTLINALERLEKLNNKLQQAASRHMNKVQK